jgi:universal stress protein A
MLPFRRVLFPTDFSRCSFEALPKAIEVAVASHASLVLVHVLPVEPPTPWDIPPYGDFGLAVMPESEYRARIEQEVGHRLAALAVERLPAALDRVLAVRRGDPAHEIVAIAAELGCDLIVMATHGWTGWRHLVFGSVAERVLRDAVCPVLVIKSVACPEAKVVPATAGGAPRA